MILKFGTKLGNDYPIEGMGNQINLKQNATRLVAQVQTQEWNHIEMHLKKSEAYYGVDYR